MVYSIFGDASETAAVTHFAGVHMVNETITKRGEAQYSHGFSLKSISIIISAPLYDLQHQDQNVVRTLGMPRFRTSWGPEAKTWSLMKYS